MSMESIFKGRRLLIATKHQKEKAMAPILERELGVSCFTLPDFDTDQLGTFTGEIERTDDPLETARQKCLRAMALADCDMAIASEGSFGPHPSIFYVHADDEILLFMDKKHELEIFVRILTTETNFNATEVLTKQELKDFAFASKFPSHALILKDAKENWTRIEKGITNWQTLSETFQEYIRESGRAYVETDMRAMFNPTRMEVIQKVTQRMVDKMKSCCPVCDTPGFGISVIKEGLPCGLCGTPTKSILSYVYACQKCHHEREEKFPNQKQTEDPMYCDICNP